MAVTSSKDVKIVRIPSTDLATYPRLDDLVALINLAFITSWRSIPGITGDDAKRYDNGAQFADEMGDHGVTWIAFDSNDNMTASAGYKPWSTVWKSLDRITAKNGSGAGVAEQAVAEAEEEKREDTEFEMERFEVVAVVVDPSLQKSGLASRLCGEVEKELRQRARGDGRKRVGCMIRTGKENNEAYWTGKGYREVGELRFPVGTLGSKTGFVILDMIKILEV